MIKKFLNSSNNLVRVLAFFLAIVLWLFVSGEKAVVPAVEKHTFTNVPLAVRNLGDNLVVMEMPENVTLTLQGSAEAIKGLTPSDLDVYIDLKGKDEGEHSVQINGTPPMGLTIVSFNPNRTVVHIEEMLTQQMTVEPNLIGSPAKGLTVRTPQYKPTQVFVKGAVSLLQQVEKIVFTVQLQGVIQDVTGRLRLEAVDAAGRVINGLTISPSFAEVTVPVGFPSKEVIVEPIFVGEPAPDFIFQDVIVRPSRVNITGAESVLADLEVLFTAEIDISGLSSELMQEVEIILPPGVEMQGEPYTAVLVIVVPK